MSKYNKFEKHRLDKEKKIKKKKRRKKFFLKLAFLTIILAIIVSVGVFVIMEGLQFSGSKELVVDQKLNFLVMGSDALNKGANRADFIMLASIDLESGEFGILSLPRDTRVKIPNKEGYHKLNSAYAYGGAELLQETIEESLKVPIDYYVSTDFNGFRDIINTLGGVEIDVAKRLKYIDQAGGLYIDIPAGKQTLYGQKALEYIRFRHDDLGDIGRIRRQQKFLKSVMDKVFTPKILLKLPQLIRHLVDNIETDLPVTKGFKLATILTDDFKNLNKDKIEMKTLPGRPKYIDGISYWLPDKEESEIVISNLIRSKEYLSNSRSKIAVFNGNGRKNIASEVANLLSQSGYKVTEIGNANNFDYSQTQVIFKSEAKSRAIKLAEYLDAKLIDWDNSGFEQSKSSEVDIKIILGKNLDQI
jgi:LCP family protein required for cell wall assembly